MFRLNYLRCCNNMVRHMYLQTTVNATAISRLIQHDALKKVVKIAKYTLLSIFTIRQFQCKTHFMFLGKLESSSRVTYYKQSYDCPVVLLQKLCS